MNLAPYQDPDVIRKTLKHKTVAIVGLSANDLRASNFVGRYLLRHGYKMIPVNPREEQSGYNCVGPVIALCHE